jgi:hypothetical protein
VSLIAQKSRYPRSSSSVQSANSSQNANWPSSGKRKTSSSASYRKSETPFARKYVSMANRGLCREGWHFVVVAGGLVLAGFHSHRCHRSV